ncbi:MAG: phospho-sugar mutase, partial [Clostridia bacterium]|nr:phospho-sugar mutase [Clostridia bacterium]
MKSMTPQQRFQLWRDHVTDPELSAQLEAIAGDPDAITERFYGDLEFGTGGLRGVIEVGSARMNIYTVGMATQGFADYINATYENPSVAVSYDSRLKSDVFARYTASVFAANGIRVYLMDTLRPTPVLSFAVRHLKCCGGVMVTASHNPSKYNGYKAYGPDGCQLSVEDSEKVIDCVAKVDIFEDVKALNFDTAVAEGKIVMVGNDLLEAYLDAVIANAIHPELCAESGLEVVYTPLNGTGKVPVTKMFERIGITDVTLVPSQAEPDGTFPTCPFPNPELKEALTEGLKLCRANNADLLVATDPDADRIGIAVRDGDDYRLLTGNEVGCLMFDYVFSQRIAMGTMPAEPIAVKTIVTTP